MTSTISKRARLWGSLLVAGTLVLSGCGDNGQTAIGRGQYTIYVHRDSILPRGGDDALVGGTVVTRDGCVLLSFGDGSTYPVIWPSGTVITDDDPLALTLRSGEQVVGGSTVSGGGGSYNVDSPMVTVDIPNECRSVTGEVLIFNPDGDIEVDA